MNPCAIGLSCPYCIEYAYDGDLKCTYPGLMVAYKWKKREIEIVGGCKCPLVEKSSDLYNWLQVMDDPTVQLAIEKANSVRIRQSVEMLDNLPYGCEWKEEKKE